MVSIDEGQRQISWLKQSMSERFRNTSKVAEYAIILSRHLISRGKYLEVKSTLDDHLESLMIHDAKNSPCLDLYRSMGAHLWFVVSQILWTL